MANIINGEISVSRNLRTQIARHGKSKASPRTTVMPVELENKANPILVTLVNAINAFLPVVPLKSTYRETSPHQRRKAMAMSHPSKRKLRARRGRKHSLAVVTFRLTHSRELAHAESPVKLSPSNFPHAAHTRSVAGCIAPHAGQAIMPDSPLDPDAIESAVCVS